MGTTAFVDDDHAIAVAIERETRVGFVIDDEPLKRLGSGRAAAVVDVLPVGLVEMRQDLRTRLAEDGGRHAVRGSVRAVQGDTHALELRRHRNEEGLVILHQSARVADEADAALRWARQRVVAGHERFDPVLDVVRQLLRAVVEELDAVVGRRVVRRADHGARDERIGLGEVREPGGRNVPDQAHLHADRAQPGRERALEHAPAAARVASDDHRVARPAEDMAGRPTQPKRELRREVEIRDASDAIGAEQPGQAVPRYLVRMVSVTRVGCTLWAVVPGGVRTTTSTG